MKDMEAQRILWPYIQFYRDVLQPKLINMIIWHSSNTRYCEQWKRRPTDIKYIMSGWFILLHLRLVFVVWGKLLSRYRRFKQKGGGRKSLQKARHLVNTTGSFLHLWLLSLKKKKKKKCEFPSLLFPFLYYIFLLSLWYLFTSLFLSLFLSVHWENYSHQRYYPVFTSFVCVRKKREKGKEIEGGRER